MPVSPQDFELYSRMTGAPMPSDAMSRMQMAPDVYNFTKNFARRPNLLEKTGNLVKNIGRGAVMALGAPLVAASEAENARMQEQLRNQADKAESQAATMENPVGEVEDTPAMAKVRLTMEANDRKHQQKLEYLAAKNAADEGKSTGVSGVEQTNLNPVQMDSYQSLLNPTTADKYGQPFLSNQTSSNIVDRKISQGSQIADSTPNVAEVLSESQDSNPVDFTDSVKVQQMFEKDMYGKSIGKRQLSKYMGTKGLDKALIGAVIESKIIPEMFGTSASVDSDLLDHPDVKDVVGGEEPNPKMGTNTNPTTNLQEQTGGSESLNKRYVDHADEMRRMEVQERRERISPSEKQVGRSPNELAGKDQTAFVAIQAGIPQEEQEAARMRIKEKTSEKRRQSTAKKAEDFKARFVEGALSDIVRGARSNQSLGITRIPATNGEAQTGFVLANKPLDQSPTSATTYGFGVDAGGEDYLKNQLGEDTFSTYMDRGMKEARQGKKRKAGEIFSYLTEPVRVVSGRAQIGNFGVIDPNFDLPSRRD